jgi:hypothetical protein
MEQIYWVYATKRQSKPKLLNEIAHLGEINNKALTFHDSNQNREISVSSHTSSTKNTIRYECMVLNCQRGDNSIRIVRFDGE